MSVEVINLTRTYGAQKAVDNISFKTKKGEILGFLGPNGAGKSTTMKIATCYIPPTSGTVIIQGYDVLESPQEVKQLVGYLPEHNPLYLEMYVKEYLEMIGNIHHLKGKRLKVRMNEMIDLCGLTLEQNKKIGSLSKGYRQRVGLSQALLHDPQVLILDEPTTGLDPNQILEIRGLIKAIGKEKTVVFSTHILQEVQALCNRVVIINKGIIVADSNVNELKNQFSNELLLFLEFEKEVDLTLLFSFPEILKIETLGDNKYKVFVKADKDIRNKIFQAAGENNWPLLGLKQEENSLENIFRMLTKGEQ